MAKQNINSKKGFTIIEVVLVLAIAGLIFLMVFVALPTLQRSQRDTQRRQDMSRLAAALTQYQANNNNVLPANTTGTAKSDASTALDDYLKNGQDFKDPSGDDYLIYISALSSTSGSNEKTASANPNIELVKYAKCGTEKAVYSSGSNNYAILYRLEGAGTSCTDNQ